MGNIYWFNCLFFTAGSSRRNSSWESAGPAGDVPYEPTV